MAQPAAPSEETSDALLRCAARAQQMAHSAEQPPPRPPCSTVGAVTPPWATGGGGGMRVQGSRLRRLAASSSWASGRGLHGCFRSSIVPPPNPPATDRTQSYWPLACRL